MATSFEDEFPQQKTEWEMRREARAACDRSGHGPYRWGYGYTHDGTVMYVRACYNCGQHSAVKKTDHPHCATGPVIFDNRPDCCQGVGCPTCETRQCGRCGSRERVEYHHWAPYHLFEDADRWPGAHLCRSCHTEWHRVVTPNMNRRTA